MSTSDNLEKNIAAQIKRAAKKYFKTSGLIDTLVALATIVIIMWGIPYVFINGGEQLASEKWLLILTGLTIFTLYVRVFTRAMDRLSGIDFSDWWAKAASTDRALYLSVRFMAVAIATAIIIAQ